MKAPIPNWMFLIGLPHITKIIKLILALRLNVGIFIPTSGMTASKMMAFSCSTLWAGPSGANGTTTPSMLGWHLLFGIMVCILFDELHIRKHTHTITHKHTHTYIYIIIYNTIYICTYNQMRNIVTHACAQTHHTYGMEQAWCFHFSPIKWIHIQWSLIWVNPTTAL